MWKGKGKGRAKGEGQGEGQRGRGSGAPPDAAPAARQVAGLQGVEALALGGLHALAVRSGGRVAAWGADQHGALGLAPEPPPLPAGTPALLARLRGEQIAQVLCPSPRS